MTSKQHFPALSDLKTALQLTGWRPSKALGQNFLFEHSVLDAIARQVAPGPTDVVLEIGAGCGFLTAHLAQTAGKVLAVEIDSRLVDIARRFLQQYANAEVMAADILRSKKLSPQVQKRLGELGGCDLVAGNLPYSTATAIIMALARRVAPAGKTTARNATGEMERCPKDNADLGAQPLGLSPRTLTFLVQEEVGQRLAAKPGMPEYGGISVLTGASFSVKLLRTVGAEVFWPKPKVTSRLVQLRPRRKPDEFEKFERFVHTLFAQPRKTAINSIVHGAGRAGALRPGAGKVRLRQEVTQALVSLGVRADVRPGGLSVAQVQELHNVLAAKGLVTS